MKKFILFIALAMFTVGASAQMQPAQRRQMDPATFVKERIADIAKYVNVTKEDSTKLHKVYEDMQKEMASAGQDREKFMKIRETFQPKIEAALGAEKYKTYLEKLEADPNRQRRGGRPAGNTR